MDGQIPQYRVKSKTFIAPHTLAAGSIIESWIEPADHLEPLNDAAFAAMDRWYNKEFQEKDKDGAPKFDSQGNPVMFKPNYSKRALSTPAPIHERAAVSLVRAPPMNTNSAAQAISDTVMKKGDIQPDLVPREGPGSAAKPYVPEPGAHIPPAVVPGPDPEHLNESFDGQTAVVVNNAPGHADKNRLPVIDRTGGLPNL